MPKNCQHNSQLQVQVLALLDRRQGQGHKNVASSPRPGLDDYVTVHDTAVHNFTPKMKRSKANAVADTIHEFRIIMLIIRGLRLTETAAATVANRLPPKYMYVSRILCFTMSGHILDEQPSSIQPFSNEQPTISKN